MTPKELPDCIKDAVRRTADEFARMMTTPMGINRQRYLAEVLAVTRAAAIGGEYRDALKGYEVIGKALGHISDAPQQHLHLHQQGAPMADKTDAELVDFMRQPKLPPPAEPPPVEPTEAEVVRLHERLDEAEAESILYA